MALFTSLKHKGGGVISNSFEETATHQMSMEWKGDSLGNLLRTMRKASGYSLSRAAQEIGCTKSFLHELEHNKAEPSFRMAIKISMAYDLPLRTMALSMRPIHDA